MNFVNRVAILLKEITRPLSKSGTLHEEAIAPAKQNIRFNSREDCKNEFFERRISIRETCEKNLFLQSEQFPVLFCGCYTMRMEVERCPYLPYSCDTLISFTESAPASERR